MKSEVDVLITKYLDGDLTSAEDRALRDLLSEHPDAKIAFDESVAIHHAIREDAETLVAPPELVDQTEEAVLMRIFGEAPAASVSAPVAESGLRRRLVSSMLLLLAFFMPRAIGNLPFEQLSKADILSTSVDAAVSERASIEVQNAALVQQWTSEHADRVARSMALPESSGSHSAQTASVHCTPAPVEALASAAPTAESENVSGFAVNGSADSQNGGFAAETPSDMTLSFNDPMFGDSFDDFGALLTPASADDDLPESNWAGGGSSTASGADARAQDVLARGSGGILALAPGVTPEIGGEIFLSGTLGSDLLAQTSSDQADAISLSTLGLAYSVSPNGRVGLELGMMNFSYPYQTLVWTGGEGVYSHPTGNGLSRDDNPIKAQQGSTRYLGYSSEDTGGTEEDPTPGSGAGQGEEEGDNGSTGQSGEEGSESGAGGLIDPDDEPTRTAYSVSQTRNKTTMWGGVFYEHEIPIRDRISFIGRLGAGGSNEGMLGYLRASGAYEMTDDLSLLFGFDSRAMLLSVFEYKNVRKLNMSFTFTMGLNVRL